MYKILLFATLAFLIIISMNCKSQKTIQLKQGLQGKVIWEAGNQMPSPDNNSINRGSKSGVAREIYIYALTNESQTEKNETLYKAINSKLIKKTTSDNDGNYKVDLEPGTYSVFTKEKDGFFANIQDGKGNINPVEIKKGKMAELDIIINYEAYY